MGHSRKAKPAKTRKSGAHITPYVMPITKAGKEFYGVGKKGAYDLANSGVMPTLTLNKTRVAIVAKIKKSLSAGDE